MTEGAYCGGVGLRYSVSDGTNHDLDPDWLDVDSFKFTVNAPNFVDEGSYTVTVE